MFAKRKVGSDKIAKSLGRYVGSVKIKARELGLILSRKVKAKGKWLAVNKVTWAQVGRVTEPGRHIFRFGWLTVTAEDLAVWEQFPNAAFALVTTTAAADVVGEEFRLGTFELWEVLSPETAFGRSLFGGSGINARRRHQA
jgi:hypothetical protein